MSDESEPRGAALVHSLFQGQPAAHGLPAEKIAALTFEGGATLPPSMAAELEHDAGRIGIENGTVRTVTFADWAATALPDWAPVLAIAFAKTFPARCFPLSTGSDSASFLYLGKPDDDGEYPVITADVDDTPEWFISAAGYDVWLARDRGAMGASALDDARIGDHAKRNFRGKRQGAMKRTTRNPFVTELLFFGQLTTTLDPNTLGRLPLVPVRTPPAMDPFFPPSPDRGLADLVARLEATELIETTAAPGGATFRARFLERGLESGAVTTVRDWLGAIADAGGAGRVSLVVRESGRPISAFKFALCRSVVLFERLQADDFDKLLSAPELAAFGPPPSPAPRKR